MKTAYETVHHEEIMQTLARQTAQSVAKAQADAVKSSQSRPKRGRNEHKAGGEYRKAGGGYEPGGDF